MISREVIQKILEAGCSAPSGGNPQPWKFKIFDSSVQIFLDPALALPKADTTGRKMEPKKAAPNAGTQHI